MLIRVLPQKNEYFFPWFLLLLFCSSPNIIQNRLLLQGLVDIPTKKTRFSAGFYFYLLAVLCGETKIDVVIQDTYPATKTAAGGSFSGRRFVSQGGPGRSAPTRGIRFFSSFLHQRVEGLRFYTCRAGLMRTISGEQKRR